MDIERAAGKQGHISVAFFQVLCGLGNICRNQDFSSQLEVINMHGRQSLHRNFAEGRVLRAGNGDFRDVFGREQQQGIAQSGIEAHPGRNTKHHRIACIRCDRAAGHHA